MGGTASQHGGSGEERRSAPAEPVGSPATQQNVTQVVITTRTLWSGVGVILATMAGLWAVNQARELTSMLVISLFFALALVPGVNHLHQKRGWKRGAAVGLIYLAGILVLALLTLVLIPNLGQLAERIGQDGTRWLTSLDRWTSDTFGIHIVSAQASRDAAVTTEEFLGRWSDKLIGAASDVVSTGVGFVVGVATIATFTFYIAADFPRLLRGFLSWFSPARQQRLGWTIDESIGSARGSAPRRWS
jgi:predicted PurR-regulated permease PerM